MKEDNNQTNHDKKDKNKIVLNKDIDLYKISIKTIKESKLSDFKGELFDEIINEMLKSEENNSIIQKKEINKYNQKIIKTINNKNNEINNTDKNINKSRKNQKIISFNKYNSDNINFKMTKLNNNSYINKKPSLKGKYPGLKEFKIEKIIFQMRYNTQIGEDLAVIGSINELGCWNQVRPLRMNWNDGNIWRATLNYNENTIFDFEYKFIFISRGYIKQWEDGNNRKFILSQIKGLIISWPGDENIIHLKNISGQNIDFNYNDNTLTIICEWNRK